MGGRNMPHPGLDRVNVSENLGKAAALPALPLHDYALVRGTHISK